MHNRLHLPRTRRPVIAPSQGTLHVIVTCSDRKTRPVDRTSRIRTIRETSLADRVQTWTDRLSSVSSDRVPAEQLYGGDHWQVVLDFKAVVPPFIRLETWVCSAGYGLVGLSTPLRPYSATFASGHADSVAQRNSDYGIPDWWVELGKWTPEGSFGPRTISKLAAENPEDFILVCVSAPYLAALSDDLRHIPAIARKGRFAIVSAGGSPEDSLRSFYLETGARMKHAVQGGMHSLNARIARRVIAESGDWYPDRRRLELKVGQWLAEAAPLERYDRERMSDSAVREFIRKALRSDGAETHSRLLRSLRDSGLACEQRRFASLFKDIRAEMPLSRTERPGRDRQ